MTVFQFQSDYGFIPIDSAKPNIQLRFFIQFINSFAAQLTRTMIIFVSLS